MAIAVSRPGRPLPGPRTIAVAALAALVLAGVVVALLRGPGSARDDASSLAGGDAAAPATTVFSGEQRQALDEDKAATTGGASANGAATGRTSEVAPSVLPLERVVRTADLRLRIRGDVAEAADRAALLATSLGGFVSSSSTSSFGPSATADLTMRVPAARFDEARTRLGRIGRIEGSELSGQDVGGQLVDLDARLRTLRSEERALDALLARSGDIGQILQVRDRLTGVRTQIEQLAGQQAALKDQAALATIHVSMRKVGAPAATSEPDRRGLGESLRTAVHAAEAVVGGMAIVLGAVAPFLALALLAWLVVRWSRRSRPATP